MKQMTLKNIAAACAGRYFGSISDGDAEITGVVIDSRQVQQGNLYIAMRGERVDGHKFIPDVFQKGAAAVLSEQELINPAGPYIWVDSCPQALKDIAEFYRSTLDIKIVGIAGSVGKTSTKEMVAAVLGEKFNVLKTEGNFNNEIGLPLTLLRIREEHEVAVVEMGISDFGEMHRLAKMARPDICVMTNIGQCHLENLIDRDGVLRAKSEIFDYLKPDGVIVLNGNDDKLSTIDEVKGIRPMRYFVEDGTAKRMNGECASKSGSAESGNATGTIKNGTDGELDETSSSANEADKCERDACFSKNGMDMSVKNAYYVVADEIENHGLKGMEAMLHFADEDCLIHEPIPGVHNIYNACAAACVGHALGLNHAEICAGISHAKTIAGRTNLIDTGEIMIIDDCYNANPVSMRASLDVLALAEGRKIAVLGDMGELGENERELHREVGAYAAKKQIDLVLTAGTLSEALSEAASAGCEAHHFATREELMESLLSIVKPSDTVLVKASHFMEFPKIVKALQTR